MSQTEPEASELSWAGIHVETNFFPLDLLCELNRTANLQPERKQKISVDEGESFPEPIGRAATLAGRLLCGINTAILKRYEPDVESSAYNMHLDPQEFQGGLVLCSLGNNALLTAFDPYIGGIKIPCGINTAVVMRADRHHKITPPEDGVRNFLFFGHACPHVLAGEVQAPIPYMDVYAGLGDLFDR